MDTRPRSFSSPTRRPAGDLWPGAPAAASLPAQERGDAHTHYAIDYIEFAVRDLTAAKRFYSAAFGWSFNDYGPSYSGIQGGSGEAGGMFETDDVKPGGPLVVLYSDDLQATLETVELLLRGQARRRRRPG